MRERLRQIEQQDRDIDGALGVVETQIDALHRLAQLQKEEVQYHTVQLNRIHDDLNTAHEKQVTVNKRTRRFLRRGTRSTP